ncbi:hypothetical protein Ancab_011114 [Ancistrocladus abbreviatus]
MVGNVSQGNWCFSDALTWLINNQYGLVEEDVDQQEQSPQEIQEEKRCCQILSCKEFEVFKFENEDEFDNIKEELRNDGPLLGEFLESKNYRTIRTSIYHGPRNFINRKKGEQKQRQVHDAHGVVLTSYGTKGGTKCWRYLNSYGMGFGIEGYGYIALDTLYLAYKFEIAIIEP